MQWEKSPVYRVSAHMLTIMTDAYASRTFSIPRLLGKLLKVYLLHVGVATPLVLR